MASDLSYRRSFRVRFYKDFMPKIYGIGAAIVIAGAMFKLLNWPGGALMLGLGLTTEAIIFFLSSFEPKEQELDWTRAYPELAEGGEGRRVASAQSAGPISEKLDILFDQAKIDGALIERLGQGMHRLSESVASLAFMQDLSSATERYVASVEKASSVLESIYEAQSGALTAIHQLTESSRKAKEYQEQVQGIASTLEALNSAYKKELDDTGSRSKVTAEVYTHIAGSMEELRAASDAAKRFETELAGLSGKLASLNEIYGNMLSAMKS